MKFKLFMMVIALIGTANANPLSETDKKLQDRARLVDQFTKLKASQIGEPEVNELADMELAPNELNDLCQWRCWNYPIGHSWTKIKKIRRIAGSQELSILRNLRNSIISDENSEKNIQLRCAVADQARKHGALIHNLDLLFT